MADPDSGTGPLRDLLVIDLARVLSGPFATMVLGDLGARVIKVERPSVGDDTRSWGPPFVGDGPDRQSTYFLSINRNKESITLDFKEPGDLAVLKDLLRRADVVVENFRPGVMQRLGLAHEELLAANPRLVVVSITGFGHDGPDAQRSGYDQILQGEAGTMSLTGTTPTEMLKVGVPIGDVQAGLYAVIGALAGLHERSLSGRGGVVRTSLLAALVSTQVFQGTRWLIGGEIPEPAGNQHPTVAPYGAFRCRDGQIQIAVGNDSLWRRFAPLIGVSPVDERFLDNQARVAHRVELESLIEAAFRQEDSQVWRDRLDECGLPVGEIKTLDRVYASEQTASQGLITEVAHPTLGPIRLPGPGLRFDADDVDGQRGHRPPPLLGEHSAAIRDWLVDGPTEPAEPSAGQR